MLHIIDSAGSFLYLFNQAYCNTDTLIWLSSFSQEKVSSTCKVENIWDSKVKVPCYWQGDFFSGLFFPDTIVLSRCSNFEI